MYLQILASISALPEASECWSFQSALLLFSHTSMFWCVLVSHELSTPNTVRRWKRIFFFLLSPRTRRFPYFRFGPALHKRKLSAFCTRLYTLFTDRKKALWHLSPAKNAMHPILTFRLISIDSPRSIPLSRTLLYLLRIFCNAPLQMSPVTLFFSQLPTPTGLCSFPENTEMKRSSNPLKNMSWLSNELQLNFMGSFFASKLYLRSASL